MAKVIEQTKGEAVLYTNLANPDVVLDLTRDPWMLSEGQASEYVGGDIIHPGRMGPDGGRLNLGTATPAGETIVDVATGGLYGVTTKRDAGCLRNCICTTLSAGTLTYGGVSRTLHSTGTPFTNWIPKDYVAITDTGKVGTYEIESKSATNEVVLVSPALGTTTYSFPATDFPNVNYVCRGLGYMLSQYAGKSNPLMVDARKNGLIKGPAEYAATGAWPSTVVGESFYIDSDDREATNVIVKVASRSTTYQANDTIVWDVALTTALTGKNKFYRLPQAAYDKRGIWLTNGRKFWLYQNLTWTLYLDLGTDIPLGTRWNLARISDTQVMAVNPKYPPRIIRLNESVSTAVTDDMSYAGLLPPKKPATDEIWQSGQSSWLMTGSTTGGSIAGSTTTYYKVKVRAVNLDDGSESEFVDVHDSTTPYTDSIKFGSSTSTCSISVWTPRNVSAGTGGYPPVFHGRWTHIEIWRTQANGSTYFLERRINVSGYPNEVESAEAYPRNLVAQAPTTQKACTLSDVSLAGQTEIEDADLFSGKMPPVCKQAASLDGITICAGASDASPANIVAYSRNYAFDSACLYHTTTGTIRQVLRNSNPNTVFANATAAKETKLVIVNPPELAGTYDVVDIYNDGELAGGEYAIQLSTEFSATYEQASSQNTNITGYLLRKHEFAPHTITVDEELAFSRTDTFAPESFSTERLRLSSINDTFRKMVPVGNYIAAIFDQGVHLVYRDATTGSLAKDTVASIGAGTPWADSVAVVDNNVVWATSKGPYRMAVSNEANQDGFRGVISSLDSKGNMWQWFRDAYVEGDAVDIGVDTDNSCIRFRRSKASDIYWFSVAQYNYKYDRWVILEDDNGFRYIDADIVESATSPRRLYTITSAGNILRVNNYDNENYTGKRVAGLLSAQTAFTTTTITSTGNFSTLMVGDTVRFRSTNVAVDGEVRVITAATANQITFAAVTGLASADYFMIGCSPYRIKFATLAGQLPEDVKTLVSMRVDALPGGRYSTSPGEFTVRAYIEHSNVSCDEELQEVPVFNASDSGKTTSDRYSAIEAQGCAIVLELELIEPKTDFRLATVAVRFREELQEILDATA